MEDLALRHLKAMSPVRCSYPIDYKMWHDGLRGQNYNTSETYYYLLNPSTPPLGNYKSSVKSRASSTKSEMLYDSNNMMTTAATKFVNKAKVKIMGDERTDQDVAKLKEENEKILALIRMESRRHEAEKVFII